MSVSAGWIKLSETKKNDFYYRKVDLYRNIKWTNEQGHRVMMNLSDYLIETAPYGGPIAMIKRYDEFTMMDQLDVKSSSTTATTSEGNSSVGRVQTILIFSAAGKFLNSIELPKKESEVCNLGWTSDLKLMVLTSGGKLFLFTVHGEICSGHWNMQDNKELDDQLNIVEKQKVEDEFISIGFNKHETVQTSCMWGQGCAVYTSDRRLFVADDFTIEKPFKSYPLLISAQDFPDFDSVIGNHVDEYGTMYSYRDMKTMVAIPAHVSSSEVTEIILAPEDVATLIVVSSTEIIDRRLFKHFNKIDRDDATQEACIQQLQVSPDGATVSAIYLDATGKSEVLVFNNSIDNLYLRFETRTRAVPTQLAFCGNEALCIYWHPDSIKESEQNYLLDGRDDTSLMLLVDCFGVYTNFTFDGPLNIVTECDGVRIYTNNSCQLMERIHDSTVSVFKIGSLEPCALLFDAYSEFCHKESKSIKTIRDIRNKSVTVATRNTENVEDNELSALLTAMNNDTDALKDAVEKCIEAACREFDSDLQKKLLKAAVYGRTFLAQALNATVGMTGAERKKVIEMEYKRLYQTQTEHLLQTEKKDELVYRMIKNNKIANNAFTTRCKEIRVLNEIRNTADIPLTYQQYEELTATALIGRLSEMNHHYLAHKICELLKLKPYGVLEHWACVKVRSQEEDSFVFKTINKHLKKHKPHVSYAKVALKAFQLGRKDLAQKLLAADVQPMDQIPIYLSMHETNKAVERAMESNDADLLVLVTTYMMKNFDKKYMFEFLAEPDKELARKLFLSFCKYNESFKRLEKFHVFMEDDLSSGMVNVKRAYSAYAEDEADSEDKYLHALQRAETFFARDKYETVNKDVTITQRSLLTLHKELEQEISEEGVFTGKTLHDTLYEIMVSSKLTDKQKKKTLKRVQAQFPVSEKRFWYVKVQALAHLDLWTKLEEFCFKSGKKTSPIGYEPFVDACLKKGQEKEAMKYIPHVKTLQVKVDYYISLLKFKEAIESARDAYSVPTLEYIRKKTTNTKTIDTIDKLIAQM
jgi:hypothetical protein